MRETTIYLQWYPYRFKSGYMIEDPSEEGLEVFYNNVRVSDPYHESFILKINRRAVSPNINMMTIDEYVKKNILPYLYCK